MDDMKAIGAIAGVASAAGTSSITVATMTASAPGLLGILGFTTTTVVALPVAGVLATSGLIAYGLHKGFQMAEDQKRRKKKED
jgi:hypothetical protein